jgi:hypothetical protein
MDRAEWRNTVRYARDRPDPSSVSSRAKGACNFPFVIPTAAIMPLRGTTRDENGWRVEVS